MNVLLRRQGFLGLYPIGCRLIEHGKIFEDSRFCLFLSIKNRCGQFLTNVHSVNMDLGLLPDIHNIFTCCFVGMFKKILGASEKIYAGLIGKNKRDDVANEEEGQSLIFNFWTSKMDDVFIVSLGANIVGLSTEGSTSEPFKSPFSGGQLANIF